MTSDQLNKFLSKPRESEIFLLIGGKQCGKTTQALKMCQGKTMFIVSYSPNDRGLSKYRTIKAEDIDMRNIKPGAVLKVDTLRPDKNIYETLHDMSSRVFNSVIFLDDSRSQVGANPGGEFIQAVGAVRHNGNDIFLTYWSPNHPSPFIYEMADHLLLFKTSLTSFDRSLAKIPRADEIQRAYQWIQSPETPNYSHAYIFLHPMHPMSAKPFIKVTPKN